MKELILAIDDEPDILELLEFHIKEAGFKVETGKSIKELYKFLDKKIPDLVLLDIMLPDMDGLEACRRLKSDDRFSGIPIIMLTSKAEETDKVLGLEFGADDYITKPFSPRELMARVRAVLRRSRFSKEGEKLLVINNILTIDIMKFEVFVEKKRIRLTSSEFKILELLSRKPGWVFSRDQILSHIWGDGRYVTDRTIDVHIKNLREKLGPLAGNFIKNVRSIGYKLSMDED
jgi:two-component system phosphate regulon response regulator PhoB/two-component system alkaline phosphatase synthesis response regulator PhoP